MLRSLLALGLLAGCATPPALVAEAPADAPAQKVSLRPLDPAAQPDLPEPLRSATPANSMRPAPGHHAMRHSAGASAAPAATPLAETLAAYLALHDALASDRLAGVAISARAFGTAFALAIQRPPEGDAHFWHMRAGQTEEVLASASQLEEAADLASARSAFGELSAPFAALVKAHGMPEGFNLVRHTCGMQPEAREGGVWLQREEDVRTPYFGAAMQMCARESTPASSPAEAHEGHGDHHVSPRS